MNIRTTIEFEDVDSMIEKIMQTGVSLLHDYLIAKVKEDMQSNGVGIGAVHTPEDADNVFGRAGAAG